MKDKDMKYAYMVICEWTGYDNEYYVFDKLKDAKDQFRTLFRKGRTKKDYNGYTVEECIKQNYACLNGRTMYITTCKVYKKTKKEPKT